MENPVITLKLEILGNLVLHLNGLARAFPDDELDVVDEEFDSTVETVRRLKEELLEDLDEYFRNAKINNEPVYLPYWTVRKELQNAEF